MSTGEFKTYSNLGVTPNAIRMDDIVIVNRLDALGAKGYTTQNLEMSLIYERTKNSLLEGMGLIVHSGSESGLVGDGGSTPLELDKSTLDRKYVSAIGAPLTSLGKGNNDPILISRSAGAFGVTIPRDIPFVIYGISSVLKSGTWDIKELMGAFAPTTTSEVDARVYIKYVRGVATLYVAAPGEVIAPNKLYIATVRLNSNEITRITPGVEYMSINGNAISPTRRGQSIPATSPGTYPGEVSQMPWGNY